MTSLEALAAYALDVVGSGRPMLVTPEELSVIAAAGPGAWDAALVAATDGESVDRPVGSIRVVHRAHATRRPRRPT